MYSKVCDRNHQTPSKLMTLEQIKSSLERNISASNENFKEGILSKLKDQTIKNHFAGELTSAENAASVRIRIESLRDQVKTSFVKAHFECYLNRDHNCF